MSVLGKRPYCASCSSAYFLISSMILRFESGAVILRSISVVSKCRSSSRGRAAWPRSRVDEVDLLAFLEEEPFMRTSELTLTTS